MYPFSLLVCLASSRQLNNITDVRADWIDTSSGRTMHGLGSLAWSSHSTPRGLNWTPSTHCIIGRWCKNRIKKSFFLCVASCLANDPQGANIHHKGGVCETLLMMKSLFKIIKFNWKSHRYHATTGEQSHLNWGWTIESGWGIQPPRLMIGRRHWLPCIPVIMANQKLIFQSGCIQMTCCTRSAFDGFQKFAEDFGWVQLCALIDALVSLSDIIINDTTEQSENNGSKVINSLVPHI